MSELARLSFSIEESLLAKLEQLVRQSSYANRSEFIRDMIRARLVERQWQNNEPVLGTVTLIYDHHARRLSDKLNELQHHHHGAVLATTHVHLDNHICAEMIMVKGRAGEIRKFCDLLGQQKGVLHADLSISSTGKKLN